MIGDEDSVLGFGLVGIQGRAVVNAEEAEQAFKSCLEDHDIGIVVITERIAELIRSLVDQYLFTKDFPLIVEIPDRQGGLSGRLSIRELVNEAIGIKL